MQFHPPFRPQQSIFAVVCFELGGLATRAPEVPNVPYLRCCDGFCDVWYRYDASAWGVLSSRWTDVVRGDWWSNRWWWKRRILRRSTVGLARLYPSHFPSFSLHKVASESRTFHKYIEHHGNHNMIHVVDTALHSHNCEQNHMLNGRDELIE